MLDFFEIKEEYYPRKKTIEVFASFKVTKVKDLMVRGKAFYAVWDEEEGMWSTDELDVARLVDKELYSYAEKKRQNMDSVTDIKYSVRTLADYATKSWKDWKDYVSKLPDNSKPLDTKIAFANTPITRKDYISKKLDYSLESGKCSSYDKIMRTLYSPEEREKIEWAIGAIISGDAKSIQKFLVLYGDPGTGKSTILEIIQKLFAGYYTIFEAESLTSSNNVFSTEQFKTNPLVAIQHDGDLSRIEKNNTLNSIVSHEEIVINEKYKSGYTMRSNCFLFMATNKPVKITDAKAGLLRRLIDVRPTGKKLPIDEYEDLVNGVNFELGSIANHCLKVYESMGRSYYNGYRPIDMMFKTDPFFNFVEEYYDIFKKQDGTTLKQAYMMYKEYCDETESSFKMPKYKFREELKDYFREYTDGVQKIDGSPIRCCYTGFLTEKFLREQNVGKVKSVVPKKTDNWLKFDGEGKRSIFDELCADLPAQYANADEVPSYKWDNVTTVLKDIDTKKLHYVKVPENHIVIDFDLKDDTGNKSFELNLAAASKWPKTYAETSKSGNGIHLHYIYTGDPKLLSRVYDDDIEIKVFTGNSSLRRKLVKFNKLAVSEISSGLPLRKEKPVINKEAVKSEKGLRVLIKKNLNKEYHAGTKPSVDFIYKILEDSYNSGLKYDVSDMRNAIFAFAANSSHQSEYCMKLVQKMKFKSEEPTDKMDDVDTEHDKIIFYDVEVFPNLFLINWKMEGADHKVVRMINPTPQEVEALTEFKLVGFNCRRYDNHILYARIMGYTNEQLYNLSRRIVEGDRNAMFGEAYNISYTDVYDYAAKKQSLKKWEIELKIHHQELGLPWDQPVDESLWEKVAEYCDNDVIATEAVWDKTQGDFKARMILAEIAGGSVNDTTNTLTTKLIFGNNRKPQNEFCYRNLAEPVNYISPEVESFLKDNFPDMMKQPHGEAKSILPYFPGYTYDNGKSLYLGEEVGEGGFVWAKPGMYKNVITFDVASMHPHSVTSECLFGPYTKNFNDLMNTRVFIKHKDFESAKTLFDGKLSKYLDNPDEAKALANALKIAINSVYGLTAAKFENPFRDLRNKDNIVAKRGALFMIDLLNAVKAKGGNVIHIKTDSIKVQNPDEDLTNYILNFGKRYGYDFEVEHKFEKICLVNNAVYIGKVSTDDPDWLDDCEKAKKKGLPEPTRWTATGTQFAVPYIFKTLFSGEKIEFTDACETKTVTSSLYLDMNEGLSDNEHNYQFIGKAGSFCPIKPGCGGGELLREKDGKYSAATGSKGYRWLEAEQVELLKKQKDIDYSYYEYLADEAKKSLELYLADSDFATIEEFLI